MLLFLLLTTLATGETVKISDILYPFLAIIEQVRRVIWSIFMLECEHIKAAQASQKAAIKSGSQKPREHSEIIPYDLEIYKATEIVAKSGDDQAPDKNLSAMERLNKEGNLLAGTLHVVVCLLIVIGTYYAFHLTY